MGIRLGVLLISGSHERAHYAFTIVAAAAALGRECALFATNQGCQAVMLDWRGLQGSERDAVIQSRGVAGFDTLREAAQELGVRLLACEMGLKSQALSATDLMQSVEIAGLASFLEFVGPQGFVTL
jgi:peroxiredoxin family protein